MAQCRRCGKKGLFFKVNSDGLCNDCMSLAFREIEDSRIKAQHEKLESQINELQLKLQEKEKLYNEIKTQAENDALRDVQEKIREKNIEFEQVSKEVIDRSAQLSEIENNLEKENKSLQTVINKSLKIKNLYKSMEYSVKNYSKSSAEYQGFLIPDAVKNLDEVLQPTVELSLHCMDTRELRKKYNQNFKQIEATLEKYQERYTTKANMAIYKLMVIALRAELQNVLYNIGYGKLDKSERDIKNITAKYLKIATDGNQHIAPTMIKFIGEIEYLFLQAINIEYEYYVKKEQIKEEQRALREQMRQEAEERRQLEQQRKQIEREEGKYQTEIQNVTQQLQETQDENKIIVLQERIESLQELLNNVERKKEDITKLQNGQAGYVYVISNLGSFGDNVFKVGMTRRLEPQDRIDELGSASVPFPFDVHSFIFSENAVSLENVMHKRLNEKRLNKVNLRKEFFKASIDEIEALVEELDPSAEFKRTMLAEQYNQSLSIDVLPELIENDALDDDDELEFEA